MNEVWNIIQPYILAIVSALGGGTIIGVIVRALCGKLINKASGAYNVNALADSVADKLGGKTINVDITALVEARLKEISKALGDELGKLTNEFNAYKPLLTLMGGAIAHLKMLSDDEREALISAVKALDEDYKPPEKEVISTIRLEPIAVAPQGEADDDRKNVVNFG